MNNQPVIVQRITAHGEERTTNQDQQRNSNHAQSCNGTSCRKPNDADERTPNADKEAQTRHQLEFLAPGSAEFDVWVHTDETAGFTTALASVPSVPPLPSDGRGPGEGSFRFCVGHPSAL